MVKGPSSDVASQAVVIWALHISHGHEPLASRPEWVSLAQGFIVVDARCSGTAGAYGRIL